MSSGKDPRWSTTGFTALGTGNDARPRVSVELDHDEPMPDALTPPTIRFDGRSSLEHARLEPRQPALSVDQTHTLTSAPVPTANHRAHEGDHMADLVSKYISAHAHATRLRDQQVALKAQNQSLSRHLTLQRSHLSFTFRDRADAARLSSVVAEQLAQMEASHERFIAVHYSAVCGLRRDEYRKLLLDYHHTQKQLRRLFSSHRESQYKFQQCIFQMAVGYVKNPPVPLEQVPHLPFSQQGPSPSSPIQAHSRAAHAPSVVLGAPEPSRRLTKRVRPPTALTTRIPHKRVQSKDAASPLDLHHPPAPTEVPAPNDKPSDKDKKSVPSGSGEGFPNGMVRSMGEQLAEVAEVASSVQLIEMNIPHSDGQRKCIICGETFLVSSDLTRANFQVLLEHLRANHP